MYNIGRLQNGIVLNPIEYLSNGTDILEFNSIVEAESYLGFSEDELEAQGVYIIEVNDDLQDT